MLLTNKLITGANIAKIQGYTICSKLKIVKDRGIYLFIN